MQEFVSEHDGNDLDYRWPAPGDKAFVVVPPCYGAWTAEDARERLWRMIRGYRQAADLLVAETEVSAHTRPDLIYPIVFAYRHSLELALKQRLQDHGRDAGQRPNYSSHRLQDIWSRCRAVIEHFNPGADPAPLDLLAGLIGEFVKTDPASVSFRYASDRNGGLINVAVGYIDLAELRKVLAGAHNFLECVDAQIAQALDGQQDLDRG